MKFTYEAFDTAGARVAGTVEASDANEATEALRRQSKFVSRLTAARGNASPSQAYGGGGGSSGNRTRLSKGKKLKNLAMFTRQLAVLVSSGTPLVDALGALERQASNPAWRKLVAALRLRVEEGASLSEALGNHPDVFDAIARSLIAAGEAGGKFDVMLDRLATLARKQLHVRQAVTGALVYPALLIVIAVNVLCLMLLFVLPRFTGLFASLDVPLPPTTQFLMTLSSLLRGYWWALIIGLIGGGVGLRFWLISPTGRLMTDTLLVRLPVVSTITKSFIMARITRVLGVLLHGRVPLLEALGLARQTARNVHFTNLVAQAEDAVLRGSTMSSVFSDSKLVSPSLVEAVKSGEKSGQVGTLLLNLSDFLDEENEVVIKSLTSILEPVILIGLGLVVGFIAISMFLPLFDLTSMAQGGAGGGH